MSINYEHMLRQVADTIQQFYGFEVKTELVRGCEFFPESKMVVSDGYITHILRFNPKVEVILALYNRALEWGEDIGETITRYVLFHAFLELDDYTGAHIQLEAFREEVHKLKLGRKTSKKRRDAANQIVLQIYFILYHEMSHIIFNHSSELKKSALETTCELLGDIKVELEHKLSTVTIEELLSHPKTIEQIRALIPSTYSQETRENMERIMLEEMKQHPYSPEYIDSLIKGDDVLLLEELSCDRQAWLNFSSMAIDDGCSDYDLLQFHLWFYVVFCAMDFTHHLQSQYRPTVSRKYTYDGKRIVFRHEAFKTLLRQYNPDVNKLVNQQYLNRHAGLASIFRTATLGVLKYQDYFERLHGLYTLEQNAPDYQKIMILESEMAKVVKKL